LFLKCENLQPMGAFKIRGAYNMVAQLPESERARGVITYSSGNHGQAVALAAQTLGVPAIIVMPTTAPKVKVDGARRYGAEVVFAGTTSLDRQKHAEAMASERGLPIIPPFDHRMVIAGQGTTGLEILEQCPTVATVLVEIGGGGLSSGVSAAIKQRAPHVRVVGVEPEGAAKMSTSLKAGKPVTLDKTASIADGLITSRPGDLTFEHVRAFVDEVVTVSDDAMIDAIGWLYHNARLVVEPSGAVTTAALMLGLGGVDPARGPVVAIVSGGNVEPAKYAQYITRA
jgi:threo-3-hydroxy-L-aspartate ammonia-lyase